MTANKNKYPFVFKTNVKAERATYYPFDDDTLGEQGLVCIIHILVRM